jgi:hypothetical protein
VYRLPGFRPESGHSRIKRAGVVTSAVAAALVAAGCSSAPGGSSVGSTAPTTSASAEATAPASAPITAQADPSATTPSTSQVDPRATQCDVEPNPHPGTFEECAIPNPDGEPVLRYDNLSDPEGFVPDSTTEPVDVICRIPEHDLDPSFTSLNGGGLYVLESSSVRIYGGLAVVAADTMFNSSPATGPGQMSYDAAVPTCDSEAIRKVTPPPDTTAAYGAYGAENSPASSSMLTA